MAETDQVPESVEFVLWLKLKNAESALENASEEQRSKALEGYSRALDAFAEYVESQYSSSCLRR